MKKKGKKKLLAALLGMFLLGFCDSGLSLWSRLLVPFVHSLSYVSLNFASTANVQMFSKQLFLQFTWKLRMHNKIRASCCLRQVYLMSTHSVGTSWCFQAGKKLFSDGVNELSRRRKCPHQGKGKWVGIQVVVNQREHRNPAGLCDRDCLTSNRFKSSNLKKADLRGFSGFTSTKRLLTRARSSIIQVTFIRLDTHQSDM